MRASRRRHQSRLRTEKMIRRKRESMDETGKEEVYLSKSRKLKSIYETKVARTKMREDEWRRM